MNAVAGCYASFEGDMVSPGLFEDYLTSENTAHVYHDSAEGYIFEFAVNLQTLNYLQTIHQLEEEKVSVVLEFMENSKYLLFRMRY